MQDGVRAPGCHGILPHQRLAPPAFSAQSGPSWFRGSLSPEAEGGAADTDCTTGTWGGARQRFAGTRAQCSLQKDQDTLVT